MKSMLRRIRRARRFLHRSESVTWVEVGEFRGNARNFIQQFGEHWELLKFDENWHDAFLLPPSRGRVEKECVERDECGPDKIPWCHPMLARSALRVLTNVMRRVSPRTGPGPGELKPPSEFRTPRGRFIWGIMRSKNLHTQLELARKAGVDTATVSRWVRGNNTKAGRSPTVPRRRILEALGLKDERKIPSSRALSL